MVEERYLHGADHRMEYIPVADSPLSTPPLRVIAIAEDPLARTGIAALISARESTTLAGQASPHEDLPTVVDAYQGDAIIWDIGSTGDDGIDRLAEMAGALPPIVALLGDPVIAGQAWAAGARALLHRDVTPARLGAAVHAAVEGATVLDDAFAEALLRRPDLAQPLREPLTPREGDVLRLLAEGHPNKAIASELGVTENTIKFHVNAIFGKLGVQSRTEAVTRAARAGLIPL
jgi:two-component system nitrate/nitrite response regulator NarL